MDSNYSYQPAPQHYITTNLVQSNGLSNSLQLASDELQSKIDGDNLKNQTKDSLELALNSISAQQHYQS